MSVRKDSTNAGDSECFNEDLNCQPRSELSQQILYWRKVTWAFFNDVVKKMQWGRDKIQHCQPQEPWKGTETCKKREQWKMVPTNSEGPLRERKYWVAALSKDTVFLRKITLIRKKSQGSHSYLNQHKKPVNLDSRYLRACTIRAEVAEEQGS